MDLSALILSGLSAVGLSPVWLIPVTVVAYYLINKYAPSLSGLFTSSSSATPAANAPAVATPVVNTAPAVAAPVSNSGPLLTILQNVLNLKSSGTVTANDHPLLSYLATELGNLVKPPVTTTQS